MHRTEVINILSEMEKLVIKGVNDINYSTLIKAFYVAGVRISGFSIFTNKVKVNEDSKVFFEKVVELTAHDESNIYRLFASNWIK